MNKQCVSRVLAGLLGLGGLLLLTLPAPSVAGGCYQLQQRQVHYGYGYGHGQHYAAPQFVAYWSVGSALREEAIAEKAAALAVQKLAEQLTAQSAYNPQQASQQADAYRPQLPQQAPGYDPANQLAGHFQELRTTSCVNCHTAAQPKGGINLDVEQLDEYTAYKAYKSIAAGRMPKGAPLGEAWRQQYDQAAGQLRQRLLEALQDRP